MSAIRFICPFCGYRAKYSRAILEEIAGAVCDYYGLNTYQVLRKWSKTDRLEGARNLLVYFVRAMTGETFKVIAGDLEISTTRIGNMIFRVEARMEEDPEYKAQVDHIRKLIVRILNPDNSITQDPVLCLNVHTNLAG